jgi:hypothetical protein
LSSYHIGITRQGADLFQKRRQNAFWTRGGGRPKNLLHFVVALIEDTARSNDVGFDL